VFLAAVMVLSVVAMSTAFVGSAAASDPKPLDGTALNDENRYIGQQFDITFSDGNALEDEVGPNGQAYLAEASTINDTGVVTELGVSIPKTNQSSNSDLVLNDVELGGLDAGTYVISSTSSNPQGGEVSNTFSVVQQDFGVDFDDDSIDEFDNSSEVEVLSQNRPDTAAYNMTVRVTGPDGNALDALDTKQLLNLQNPNTGDEAAAVTEDNAFTPMNFLDDYDIVDDDIEGDFEDDGYVTFDASDQSANGISVASGQTQLLEDDFLYLNASNLADGEGLPDRGEYEFEFIVADTGATTTGTLTLGEADSDASFAEGSQAIAAGDIADLSIDLSDAVGPNSNSAYVQIGGEDSEFADVLFVEADNADETVDIQINTRLLGTDAEEGAVYDTSNTANFESEMHGGIDIHPENPLYADDESEFTAGANNFDAYIDEIIGVDNGDAGEQLTRPLQPTEYRVQIAGTTGLNDQEGVFDADPGGEANNQLDSKTLRLTTPTIDGVTVHTAPEEDADDIETADALVEAATPLSQTGGELGVNDRLIVQFEASGIYGNIVQEAAGGTAEDDNTNFDRLTEGASTDVINAITDDGVVNESISLDIEAQAATGNVDVLEIDLTASDTESYVVVDHENEQFFVVADTSSDDAFTGGGNEAPSDLTDFTATLEYDADNEDDRYEFNNNAYLTGSGNPSPYASTPASENYPFLSQGTVISESAEFSMAPQSASFDNQNEDDLVQIQNTEGSTVSGTTNVAPGSDAELRLSTDTLQQGQNLNISSDGSFTAEFDASSLEAGADASLDYRVEGSSVATINGVIVESVGEPADDGEEPADDGEEPATNETEEPADDGETEEPADDGESTDDGTPGFGAVVALVALIGAALLAVRRQN